METLLLILVTGGGYLLAYHTYGKFLARKIFKLHANAPVPSVEMNDGVDYVPAHKGVVFGHHYTSIAGTVPIVGPAIGIIWGWLPALLWVFFGSIFMGAVHDFSSLVISVRNRGQSISEIAAKYINWRVRFLFFIIVFLLLLIVIAVFGVVIAEVFRLFSGSVFAVWLQIPIAMGLGFAVYKKNIGIVPATVVAVGLMYGCVAFGAKFPFEMTGIGGLGPVAVWVILLLIYAWIASTLPVTMLLQPRDYLNAWQLVIAMGLIVAGVVSASFRGGLPLVAPAVNTNLPEGTPSMWPTMFVIIACGAISGFHSLVSSGTSPKQIAKETDTLFVGYGSMMLESFLAVLAIVCVAAGIGIALELPDGGILRGVHAWQHQYSSYLGAQGLSGKIAPVVNGAANMITTIPLGKFAIPQSIAIALMGVFIASFAGTTLDTSVRLQRYVVTELAENLNIKWLSNRWTATSFAVLTAAGLAFAKGANGTGAMILWPLLGTSNQLLAALALLVVTLYLKKKKPAACWLTAVPCVMMLVITNWAMIQSELRFYRDGDWLLFGMGMGIVILAFWMTIEAVIAFAHSRKPRTTDSLV